MIATELIFWLCLWLVIYSYVLYAVAIYWAARIWGCKEPPPSVDDASAPSITLLISAHNEETVIRERLDNALQMSYPADKFQVVIASDGSNDRTAEIVDTYAGRGVRLLDYQSNRGKAATLNSAWDELTTDLVLLSDANTFTDREAARRLARWFVIPNIGAVCGRLVLVDPLTGNNVDGLYWRYETFLKKCEARLGALLGANGAIYAIRRESFVKIPPETIVDDFVIPLLVKLKHGLRLVYDDEAVAHEETPADMRDEFRRRSRIGAGGFQSIGLLWPLLNPRHGWLALSFWSHKILRWCSPFFLLGMLVANLALLQWPLYCWLLGAQAGFYLLAAVGNVVPGKGSAVKALRTVTLFTSMNLALLAGFFRWLTGRQRGAWSRTAR